MKILLTFTSWLCLLVISHALPLTIKTTGSHKVSEVSKVIITSDKPTRITVKLQITENLNEQVKSTGGASINIDVIPNEWFAYYAADYDIWIYDGKSSLHRIQSPDGSSFTASDSIAMKNLKEIAPKAVKERISHHTP